FERDSGLRTAPPEPVAVVDDRVPLRQRVEVREVLPANPVEVGVSAMLPSRGLNLLENLAPGRQLRLGRCRRPPREPWSRVARSRLRRRAQREDTPPSPERLPGSQAPRPPSAVAQAGASRFLAEVVP